MGHVLLDAHAKLRRGEFDARLRDLVLANRDAWRELETDVERLKANYVVAEVLDYFGEYALARECLGEMGAEQVTTLRRDLAGGRSSLDRNLFKRRVWLALAHAMDLYRSDSFDGCINVLDACQWALDEIDVRNDEFLGTRARLAQTRGRAARQLHKYDEARRHFNEAMVFARKRFVRKTDWAEQSELNSPPFGDTPERRDRFEQQRLLCHWTIGRCLASGLGYIDYTTGRLSSADTLLSAGYGLLRGTGDVIQRAYATLLMGAVLRAKAGGDRDELVRAIALLDNGANVLGQHPTLTLRASYERALAYYKRPEWHGQAFEHIRIVKDNSRNSPRWLTSALIVESRTHRVAGELDKACNRAKEAVDEATPIAKTHPEILAEARIAFGEALAAKAESFEKRKQPQPAADARRDAVREFTDALPLVSANPKMVAVCHLHLAATHIAQSAAAPDRHDVVPDRGALQLARRARDAASPHLREVEHGFVTDLAQTVDKALEGTGVFVVDVSGGDLNIQRWGSQVEAFLIRRVIAATHTLEDAARLGGFVDGSGLSRAIKRLKKAGFLPDDFGRGERRRGKGGAPKR